MCPPALLAYLADLLVCIVYSILAVLQLWLRSTRLAHLNVAALSVALSPAAGGFAGLAAPDGSNTASLQQLVPAVLDSMEAALTARNEDLLSKGVTVLLEASERPLPILQQCLLRVVAVAGRAAACTELDLATRGHCSQVQKHPPYCPFHTCFVFVDGLVDVKLTFCHRMVLQFLCKHGILSIGL